MVSSPPPENYNTPHWVKVLAASTLIVVILFVVFHLLSGAMADMHH